jgi:hypothetical protein
MGVSASKSAVTSYLPPAAGDQRAHGGGPLTEHPRTLRAPARHVLHEIALRVI